MLAPLSNFNEVRCSDAGCVPAAPAPPTVTFALNSRVPSARALATTAARACDVENDILGCAHDTWIPLLAPGVANVAILLDCGAANQSVTLWPTAAHVSSGTPKAPHGAVTFAASPAASTAVSQLVEALAPSCPGDVPTGAA